MATKIDSRPVSSNKKKTQSSVATCNNNAQFIDYQQFTKSYQFLKRYRNNEFDEGVKVLTLRSCLIHSNSAVFRTPELHVKTRPKWLTDLFCQVVDMSSGEVVRSEVYSTNEIKASNGKKIKRLDAFCSHFQPLYAKKEVSLLFFTFTLANQSKMTISGIIDVLKKRCKRRGIKMHGYIWTAEVSEKLHFHYHMAVAIDRMNIRGVGLPTWLKLESAWGPRTGVNFVRKDIRHYMAKYFAKHNARIIGIRSFGCHISKQKEHEKTTV